MPRRTAKKSAPSTYAPKVANLNEVIAYNFRAARELRGWTQEEVALRLEPLLGQRLPQASISGIERTYKGERQREFDAHEILAFALAFDLPMIWFFLPPPDDRRRLDRTSMQVDQLYGILLGEPRKLEPLYERLRQIGVDDPTEAEAALEQITGTTSAARAWSYRERRNEMLLALVDKEADRLDKAADEFGAFFDHLRRVGLRGFVAERVHPDPIADDITTLPEHRRRSK
jgi:transcriptional regulator with XRE-family HTH domain